MAKEKVDVLLKYYLSVSGTNHLHYGYWMKGEEFTMKNFRLAQERYSDHLISFIPYGTTKILDVGCGVGGNTLTLMRKEYQVVALSPDSYQRRVFEENTQGKIPFCLSTFEEFTSQEKFDLILMSESCQYIDIEKGLKKCREVLRPGGYLLVADYFKVKRSRSNEEGIPISGHSLEEYLEKITSAGFKMVNSEDITSSVSPTLDFRKEFYQQYLMPTLKIIAFTVKVNVPHLYALGNFFLGRILRRMVDHGFEKPGAVDSKLFTRSRKYMIYLFQLAS